MNQLGHTEESEIERAGAPVDSFKRLSEIKVAHNLK
jgi:hypothetical protein